jgi:hypothetical protein
MPARYSVQVRLSRECHKALERVKEAMARHARLRPHRAAPSLATGTVSLSDAVMELIRRYDEQRARMVASRQRRAAAAEDAVRDVFESHGAKLP